MFFIGQRGQQRGIIVQPQSVAEPDHIRAAQSHAGVVLVMGEQQFDNYQSKSNLNSLLTFRNFLLSFRSLDTFAPTFNLRMWLLLRRRKPQRRPRPRRWERECSLRLRLRLRLRLARLWQWQWRQLHWLTWLALWGLTLWRVLIAQSSASIQSWARVPASLFKLCSCGSVCVCECECQWQREALNPRLVAFWALRTTLS